MSSTVQPVSVPVGRFAPSPTGELHLGSLTTAVASYCHIKSLGGRWLLRIEDVDFERCDPTFSERILVDLTALGLHWDDDVTYQSERTDIYNDYLHGTLHPLAYACQCSRKMLQSYHKQHPALPANLYPRCCLNKHLNWDAHKIRLQLPDHEVGFVDQIQGMQWQNPQQTQGDMVVRRQNKMINYILAASLDDGLQGVTHVMRGLDILPMTSAQIGIMAATNMTAIRHWYHLPLLINDQGQKLSKQNLSTPIDTRDPSRLLQQALTLLQQAPIDMDTPERMLTQAVAQWNNAPLKNLQQLHV